MNQTEIKQIIANYKKRIKIINMWHLELCPPTDKKWVCYILKSINPLYTNQTYNGATNNIKNRIHQHNNTQKGAKATHKIRPNEIYCVVTGFPDKISALSCEWWIKHPNGHRKRPIKFCGINGRIVGLNHLIVNNEIWKKKFGNMDLTIFINENVKKYLEYNIYPNNIIVKHLITLDDIIH